MDTMNVVFAAFFATNQGMYSLMPCSVLAIPIVHLSYGVNASKQGIHETLWSLTYY